MQSFCHVLVIPGMSVSLSIICHCDLPAVLYVSENHTVLAVSVTPLALIQLRCFCFTCGYTPE